MIFLIFRSKIFLDVEPIYTLSLKNSWETNSYSLVCRAQSFTHACNTHARVTYLPLFNLHFYSSRYLSNIYISVNESTFFHTVCQLFDIIKGFLISLSSIWTFEFSSTFFYRCRFSLFVTSLFVLDSHQSLLPMEKLAKYNDQTCQLSKLSIKIVLVP